jgi:hypothetical protein
MPIQVLHYPIRSVTRLARTAGQGQYRMHQQAREDQLAAEAADRQMRERAFDIQLAESRARFGLEKQAQDRDYTRRVREEEFARQQMEFDRSRQRDLDDNARQQQAFENNLATTDSARRQQQLEINQAEEARQRQRMEAEAADRKRRTDLLEAEATRKQAQQVALAGVLQRLQQNGRLDPSDLAILSQSKIRLRSDDMLAMMTGQVLPSNVTRELSRFKQQVDLAQLRLEAVSKSLPDDSLLWSPEQSAAFNQAYQALEQHAAQMQDYLANAGGPAPGARPAAAGADPNQARIEAMVNQIKATAPRGVPEEQLAVWVAERLVENGIPATHPNFAAIIQQLTQEILTGR